MRLIIQHLTGRDAGKRDILPLGRISIGRDASCDVQLDLHRDLEVSSRHAELYIDPERGLCIRDLGSTNGTYIDGERVDDDPIHDGAKIELGKGGVELRLRFRRSLRERLTGRNPALPPKGSR